MKDGREIKLDYCDLEQLLSISKEDWVEIVEENKKIMGIIKSERMFPLSFLERAFYAGRRILIETWYNKNIL